MFYYCEEFYSFVKKTQLIRLQHVLTAVGTVNEAKKKIKQTTPPKYRNRHLLQKTRN